MQVPPARRAHRLRASRLHAIEAVSFVRGIPKLALVTVVACAAHAQQLAQRATEGVKAQVAQIDPTIARTIGDQAGRGAVAGSLDELTDTAHREALGSLVGATTQAVVHGAMAAFSRDDVRDQLAATARQAGTAAVLGARDALPDVFPECSGAVDRRRCVEDQVVAMSRAAARGMVAGAFASAHWPILALVFLAGVLVTLLFVRVRPAFPSRAAARRRVLARHHRRPA